MSEEEKDVYDMEGEELDAYLEEPEEDPDASDSPDDDGDKEDIPDGDDDDKGADDTPELDQDDKDRRDAMSQPDETPGDGTVTEDPKDREIAQLRQQNTQLIGAWNEFEADPVKFVRRYPEIADRMGIDARAVEKGAIEGIPGKFQNYEAQRRAAEEARLAELKDVDIDKHHEASIEVRAARAARNERYAFEMEQEKEKEAARINEAAGQEVEAFVGKFGKSEKNPSGLGFEECLKVIEFADTRKVGRLEDAYILMTHEKQIRDARIQGASDTIQNLDKTRSTTQAGKRRDSTTQKDKGERFKGKDDLDLTDEEFDRLSEDEQRELGLLI